MATVMIHGQQVGRIKASFLLAAESFRFLKADPEMLLLPIIGFFLNIALWIPAVFFIFFGAAGGTFAGLGTLFPKGAPLPNWAYIVVFYGFFVSAFTLAFVQAGIAHFVSARARGENATLASTLGVVMSLLPALLTWSLIAATVGFVLRQIAERSKIVTRIIIAIIGAAWSVLTYFVIPAIVIERQSAVASIKRSGKVFRDSWGETIVSNISLSGFFMLIFFLLIVLYAVLTVLFFMYLGSNIGLFVLMTFLFLFVLFMIALVSNTLTYVLKTLLFIYATEGTTASNFDADLLANMLVKKPGAMQPPMPPQPPVPSAPQGTM